MSHHLAGVAGKVQQQVEFLGRQVDGFALDGNAVRLRIHNKVTRLKGRRGAIRSAAQVSPHASKQFLNAKGLGHIVVGARVKSFNL